MYKIKFSSPTLSAGEVVTVDGLGALVNGETVEFDDSVNDAFRQATAVVAFDNGDAKLVLGKDLVTHFKNHSTITVTHVKNPVEKSDA